MGKDYLQPILITNTRAVCLADDQAARVRVGARRPAVAAHSLPLGSVLLADVPVGRDSSVALEAEAGLRKELVH